MVVTTLYRFFSLLLVGLVFRFFLSFFLPSSFLYLFTFYFYGSFFPCIVHFFFNYYYRYQPCLFLFFCCLYYFLLFLRLYCILSFLLCSHSVFIMFTVTSITFLLSSIFSTIVHLRCSPFYTYIRFFLIFSLYQCSLFSFLVRVVSSCSLY